MEQREIAALEGAVNDLNGGDIETFIGLMADDMVWSGHPHGWLWWRQRPH